MSDSISVTIEYEKVEVTILQPDFIQVNLLEPTILASVSANTTHRSSDGKDHSDVVLNNTHRVSDGKAHSDVVLNNSHRAGDGTDHSAVDETFNRSQKVEKSKLDLTVGLNETLEIDLNTQGWVKVVVTGNNATITIINWPVVGKAGYLTLELFGAGAFTGLVITNGKTSEGNALDLSSGQDFVQCASRDAGVTVILSQVGKAYA